MLLVLANDIQKTSHWLEREGLYPTIVAVTVGVFVLAYLARAVENYIRHLHRKPYLPYSNLRFILTVAGCALVADGFLVGFVFQERLPLHVATVTTSAGLLCLITSVVLSIVPYVRQIRRVRSGRAGPDDAPGDPRRADSGDDGAGRGG